MAFFSALPKVSLTAISVSRTWKLNMVTSTTTTISTPTAMVNMRLFMGLFSLLLGDLGASLVGDFGDIGKAGAAGLGELELYDLVIPAPGRHHVLAEAVGRRLQRRQEQPE